MSRGDRQRLDDILAAIEAIGNHMRRGDLTDPLVFDAVRVRLIEIGDAVKSLPSGLLAHEPGLPWVQIAGMRIAWPTGTSTHRIRYLLQQSNTTFRNLNVQPAPYSVA